MLSTTSQLVSHVTRRTASILVVGGCLLLALLILKSPTYPPLAGTSGVNTAHAADAAPNDKPATAAERNDKTAPASGTSNARAAIEFLPRPSPEEERILAALATPVDVEFVDVPLEDCLSFIGGYEKLPQFTVFLDRATLTDEGVEEYCELR